jgi:hypothetical protein
MRIPLLGLLATLTACASTRIVPPHGAQGCALAASGTEISCGGQPFASIKGYFCSPSERVEADGSAVPWREIWSVCRGGLAVLYADGTVAWLFRGFDLNDALVRGEYRGWGDSEVKGLHRAHLVRTKSDGRFIRYGVMFSNYEYSLEEGVVREVDKASP